MDFRSVTKILGRFPFYVFSLVPFFLTHGYSENVGLVPLKDMLVFFLIAQILVILILNIFRKLTKSWIKAALLTSLLFTCYLFYGAMQDGFKSIHMTFLARYIVLVPMILLMVVGCFIYLKRSGKDLSKITLYLNTLLIVLIVADIFNTIRQLPGQTVNSKSLITSCDTCNKPNIYLIVMDEYWGTDMLTRYFGYDNHSFISFLTDKGFRVLQHPSCNYAVTPISMATTFDMQYANWLHGRKALVAEDFALVSSRIITNSNTIQALKSMGYHFNNCSIFDVLYQPAAYNFAIMPVKMRLITAKTFFSRAEKDLLWNVKLKWASKSVWLAKWFQSQSREGNKIIERKTYEVMNNGQDYPSFTYTHLMMPHQPSLYDSLGNDIFLNYYGDGLSGKRNDSLYLQYLVYTNNVVKSMVSALIRKTKGKAVIIVMSDHGYRYFYRQDAGASRFNNFNAVYLPSKNYDLFYDSMSNVNQFRVIFNSLFNQKLSMLKDSIAF